MHIIVESEEQKQERANRENKIKRHCRIGKVRMKFRLHKPSAPKFPAVYPPYMQSGGYVPVTTSADVAWWNKVICS